jgi:Spy/CpxP family protein refolding chaperone
MKRLLIVTILMVSAVGLTFGQRGGPRGENGLMSLKNALDLTDAQVTAITALMQNERSAIQSIRSDVQQKRTNLNALLNSGSPAPVDVGNAAIALHASEARIKAEHDSLLSQIKQQLTADQQQKLDTLMAANGGRGVLPGFFGPRFGGPQR